MEFDVEVLIIKTFNIKIYLFFKFPNGSNFITKKKKKSMLFSFCAPVAKNRSSFVHSYIDISMLE